VDFAATAADAVDGDVAPTCVPASGSMFGFGTTPVQCTASDSASNPVTGSFTVTVTDTTAPALTLPATMTAAATSADGAVVTYDATATDAVEGVVAVACDPASGSTFVIGTTTVECSASDSLGNQSTGSFTVTVTDTGPALILPDDMTVEATGAAGADVDYTATATDAVDGDITPTCVPASGSTFGIGTTTVYCTAIDTADNTTTGNFTVTVIDTGPVLVLPDDMTVEATGPNGGPVTYTATATDAVDGIVPTVCTLPSGGMAPLGDTLVVCRADDSAGNRALDSFVVSVVDTTGPVLDLAVVDIAATSAAGAVVDYTATATDAVEGDVAVACAPLSGSTFVIGTTTVACSASDSLGNPSTGSFNVTVTDTGPALILPDDMTVEATSAAGATVEYTATATDAVDGVIAPTCGPAPGSTFGLGNTTVNCSATDTSGNQTNGSFTVTVTDTTAPVLTLPDDITLPYQGRPKGAGLVVDYTATATDAVDGDIPPICEPPSGSKFGLGTTTVDCTAIDSAGSQATGTFTVTIERVSDDEVDDGNGKGRGGGPPKK
jgi:xanthine/CO dehydrogenase XdhC/CoxF family maturation factor